MIKYENNIGSIRARGQIKIVQDLPTKEMLSKAIPFFDGYWQSYTDPEFALLKLSIQKFEVQSPYDKKFYYFNLD